MTTRRTACILLAFLLLAGALLAGDIMRFPCRGPVRLPSRSAVVLPRGASGGAPGAGSSTAPPSAPLNLTFTSTSTDTATLGWSASTGATSYELDIYEDAAFSTGRAVLSAGVGNVTTYTLTGQPAGVTLHARVRAVGAGGTSGNSTATSGTLIDRTQGCTADIVYTLGNAPANWASSTAVGQWVQTVGTVAASQTAAASRPVASGSALSFSGAGEPYLELSDPAVVALTQPFTIIVKARPDTGSANLIDSYVAASNRVTLSAYTNKWSYYAGGTTIYGSSTVTMSPQVVAAVYGGSNSGVYIDGAFSVSGAIGANTPASGLAVGRYMGGGFDWDGDCYRIDIASGSPSLSELASTTLWLDAPPRGPTIEPVTASTTTTLVASFTHLTGAYGYRVDLATASGFTAGSFLPGYESRIVATSSAGGLTLDVTGYTGQTVYLRMRSAGAGGIGPSSSVTTCVVP